MVNSTIHLEVLVENGAYQIENKNDACTLIHIKLRIVHIKLRIKMKQLTGYK